MSQLPFRNSAWSGDFHGIVPVIPTPFDEQHDVDLPALAPLIEFAAAARVKAACLPAYGSEFYKLSGSERARLVGEAVRVAGGRIKIVAQSNHPSARLASEIARRNEAAGADLISFALPRIFALSENDLLRYSAAVASSVKVPVLVQDFNPGGASVGADFARRLHEAAPNFRFLKLEEPGMAPKIRAIHDATGGTVGVLEGWGGMYLLELLPAGICGTMPGLAMVDLFQRAVRELREGSAARGAEIFERMLPFIVYSLQNMEVFHHAEKLLLVRRGVLKSAAVRDASLALDASAQAYLNFLCDRILDCAEQVKEQK